MINPESFGQSVENMFHTSFLIKENQAQIFVDEVCTFEYWIQWDLKFDHLKSGHSWNPDLLKSDFKWLGFSYGYQSPAIVSFQIENGNFMAFLSFHFTRNSVFSVCSIAPLLCVHIFFEDYFNIPFFFYLLTCLVRLHPFTKISVQND